MEIVLVELPCRHATAGTPHDGTVPDHDPLTRDQVAALLDKAAATGQEDWQTVSTVQVRLSRALPGWQRHTVPPSTLNRGTDTRNVPLGPDNPLIRSAAVIALLEVTGCHHSTECVSGRTRELGSPRPIPHRGRGPGRTGQPRALRRTAEAVGSARRRRGSRKSAAPGLPGTRAGRSHRRSPRCLNGSSSSAQEDGGCPPAPWWSPGRLNGATRSATAIFTGLARVPAAVGEGEWEYEDRAAAVPGARCDFAHEDGRVTVCYVRYMTRAEITDTYRRALTGDLSSSMRAAAPRGGFLAVTADDVRRELAGRDLACWCPLPASPAEPDHRHAAVLLATANQPPSAVPRVAGIPGQEKGGLPCPG